MLEYQLRRFSTEDSAGLTKLADLIHDEEFDVADVRFDSKLGVATIPFRRIFHGGPGRVVRKTLFTQKREVEVLHAVIYVKHVTDAKITDAEKIGTYTFEEVVCETAASQLVFKACPKLELRFSMSKLEIEYEETGAAGKAVIISGLFWQKSKLLP
jgi:hypothetical protein